MRSRAKPPQRERKGAGEERTGGGEGGEGAGKAKQSKESEGGAQTMGARKKKKKQTKHQSTAHTNSEVSKERKKHDAPDWSVQVECEHSPRPRTRSSGGEPGATDWSVRGNGENTTKRRPGLEQPGRNEAQP